MVVPTAEQGKFGTNYLNADESSGRSVLVIFHRYLID